MDKYLLTFEWNKGNEQLEVHGNREGLIYLKELIEDLLAADKSDHAHLFTWEGDLTEEPQLKTNKIIHQVKIFFWKQ